MREVGWYDYPQYFDMVFRDETAAEVNFFKQAFDVYATGTVKRLYEPGCGSGRLVVAMAAAGYTRAYNVAHGFEGDPDSRKHRGRVNGWKMDGLPWVQS